MHLHRDLLAIADGYAKEVLNIRPDDIIVGTPPLAFTFGLGALVVFPLRFGAASALLEDGSPAILLNEIRTYKATISFAGPACLSAPGRDAALGGGSSRRCASPSRRARRSRPRLSTPGRSATASPCSTASAARSCSTSRSPTASAMLAAGAAGRPVAGYEARIVDDGHAGAAGRPARPARRARPDRLPLPRRSAPERFRARWLEPHRRHLPEGRGGALPLRGARRRHDRVVRRKHRRPGGRGGAEVASLGRRMRRGRHRRQGARTRS